MTNNHTRLPLLARGNMHDSDGFPCVVDAADCVVFSVWDEGRTIDQAEELAVHITNSVNYHQRLRDALDDMVDMWAGPPTEEWERARALLEELDNLEVQP